MGCSEMKFVTYQPCIMQLQFVVDRMWRPHQFRPELKLARWIHEGGVILPTGHER